MGMYDLTYLGHAGFMLETDDFLFLMDPWLSESGAFDASWFQFPCNHHLQHEVLQKILDTYKPVYLYISHEHQDHWDPRLIERMSPEPTLFIPRFTRDKLRAHYHKWPGKMHVFTDNQMFTLPGNAFVEFYINDSVREADSALLIKCEDRTFLNMNDCHIHDRLGDIQQVNGKIDIFTGCFSGASWYPTCYVYSDELHDKKAKKNMYARFVTMRKCLQDMKPDFYIPSAGPACFLDDDLFDLNFQEDSIFPMPDKFYGFLDKGEALGETTFAQMLPGEKLDLHNREDHVVYYPDLREVLEEYQERAFYALEARDEREPTEWDDVKLRLTEQLQAKVEHFPLIKELEGVVLQLQVLGDSKSERGILVDFKAGGQLTWYAVKEQRHSADYRYTIFATVEDFAALANKQLTWYEWLLSFRLSIRRNPDTFNSLLDGFLVNEPSEMKAFCEHYAERSSAEKITVQVGNTKYKVCKRCPHEGADLSKGFTDADGNLVCPKHSWKFNLKKRGYCEEHNATIDAVRIDE